MDKRIRPRIPLKLAGKIVSKARNAVDGRTRDISSVGAYFDSQDIVPEGADVEVELFLPVKDLTEVKGREAKIKVSGTVVRVEKGGVAVLFKGMKVLFRKTDEP